MYAFYKQSFSPVLFCCNHVLYFSEIDTSIPLFLFFLSLLYDPPASRTTFPGGMFKAL